MPRWALAQGYPLPSLIWPGPVMESNISSMKELTTIFLSPNGFTFSAFVCHLVFDISYPSHLSVIELTHFHRSASIFGRRQFWWILDEWARPYTRNGVPWLSPLTAYVNQLVLHWQFMAIIVPITKCLFVHCLVDPRFDVGLFSLLAVPVSSALCFLSIMSIFQYRLSSVSIANIVLIVFPNQCQHRSLSNCIPCFPPGCPSSTIASFKKKRDNSRLQTPIL